MLKHVAIAPRRMTKWGGERCVGVVPAKAKEASQTIEKIGGGPVNMQPSGNQKLLFVLQA